MADVVARQRRTHGLARGPCLGIDQRVHRAGIAIDADEVAVAQLRQRAGIGSFRGDVDGRQHLARCTGHASVGEQGDALAAVLQGGQGGRELVQFGHAIRARTLAAHDRHEIPGESIALVERTGLERRQQRVL